MGNKFVPWIDTVSGNTNIQDADTFAADAQRQEGFKVGTVASSQRANTAIRQANLVAAALMNAMLPDTELDLTSDVEDVIDEMEAYFNELLRRPATAPSENVLAAIDTNRDAKNAALGQGLQWVVDEQGNLSLKVKLSGALSYDAQGGVNLEAGQGLAMDGDGKLGLDYDVLAIYDLKVAEVCRISRATNVASAVSSDNTKATVTFSGRIVTVTGVGAGDCTITIDGTDVIPVSVISA